ncbi:hypothetical protein [Streptomyces lavendofoliae]|uniref:Uncharacterized protein n=1 Tax=Streptomyces lavendofoliae TaxID=67314 RepID=A0A918I3B3_9ACTN|nr:hypothetical protein [Streptomyces lavendofoliae]GGU62233.1 hypothetical protein GCM10010274_58760 [Streptomyces lavendofoliae]
MTDYSLDDLNRLAARWEHGHAELVQDCAVCRAEFAAVMQLVHGCEQPCDPGPYT